MIFQSYGIIKNTFWFALYHSNLPDLHLFRQSLKKRKIEVLLCIEFLSLCYVACVVQMLM